LELPMSEAERELLVQVLEERQAHFLHEIAKADHHDFKQALRHRCELLEKVLEKLKVNVPVSL
jgi:hypothetical protein